MDTLATIETVNNYWQYIVGAVVVIVALVIIKILW
jgi:predicted ABC-type sugar transport system permease subunit